MTEERPTITEVLYNADCPVCNLEIDHYERIARRRALPISFADLNDKASLDGWKIGAEQAARRLHVRREGKVLSGTPAFIALWHEMPGYRWLARVVSLPGIFRVSVWLYDRVLAPMLYRLHLRRQRRAGFR